MVDFSGYKKSNDGKKSDCKKCLCKLQVDYSRTKRGLASKIYFAQVNSCRNRGHELPSYTIDELYKWLLNQVNFNSIYENWVKSKYDKMLYPSIDRLDDYLSYSFKNIRLVTWQENKNKGNRDRFNGTNNKINVPVLQYDLDGVFIKEHHSIASASRDTGSCKSSLRDVCIGVRSNGRRGITSNGFIWKFKNK